MQQRRLLLHEDDVFPDVSEAQRAQIASVHAHHALVGVEQPQQQVRQGGLAAAARAHDGHRGAGGHPQREVLEHGQAALGAERHGIELDVAAHRDKCGGIRRLAHVERRVEQFQHPAPRHLGGGQRRIEPHQRLHRRVHPRLVSDEGRERAQRERAGDHARSAVEEHGRRAQRHHEAGQPSGQVGESLHAHQRVDEAVIEAPEATALPLLRIRRHHQRRGLQRLDQEAADVGAALAQVGDARLELGPVAHEQPQADWHHGGREQRQPPVEPHQHHDAAHEEQHVAHPGQGRLGGHALNLADVAVETRHDIAHARARVEAR